MTAPPVHVQVNVLGPVTVLVAGQRISGIGPGRLAVLARLVTAHGRPVTADRLVDDLWEGTPPAKAPAALQAHISHLRGLIEPVRAAHAPARRPRRYCLP